MQRNWLFLIAQRSDYLSPFLKKAILLKDLDYSSPDVTYLEFDVVCNFRREQIRFHIGMLDLILTKSNIRLYNSGNAGFFFNNLKIFSNYDFYFDYTSTEHCWLFYNIASMQCLKTKQGYVQINNVVYDKSYCYSLSTAT